mgnify:FL=1
MLFGRRKEDPDMVIEERVKRRKKFKREGPKEEKIKTILEMKRIFVDLDGVCCDIRKLARQKFSESPEVKYPQSQYGFFIELEEIENSVSSIKELSKNYDVWFLSAPSTKNPMSYAEKNYWIRIHFGQEWCDKLILCPDKSLLIGDYLIDDNLSGRGQDRFIGEFIHFGSDKYKNWSEVLKYFI